MNEFVVEAIDLHYAYPDGTAALRGVSLKIATGESVAIVGENGAGKSTLLQHLNGFLMPHSGSLRIGPHVVSKVSLSEVRRLVGMVFQDPDDQLFMPTVFDDVAFGPLHMNLAPDEVVRRSHEALERVGIAHLKERPPYRLSGGEKRAAAIACVLSMNPDILVMDEPTSGLDPQSRRRVIDLLATFTHTKIIATHDLDMVLDVCPRAVVLHQGSVKADGLTPQLLQDEALLTECGLEKPLRLQSCPICSSHRSDSKPE